MSDDKIVQMPSKFNELAASAAELKGNMPAFIEYGKIIAEIKWNSYQAFLEQGFTKEQALELTKESLTL